MLICGFAASVTMSLGQQTPFDNGWRFAYGNASDLAKDFGCGTEYLNYGGSNVVAVRVDASEESGWFYEGAGIYRHVWLKKTPLVHIAPDGVSVAFNGHAQILLNGLETEAVLTITLGNITKEIKL